MLSRIRCIQQSRLQRIVYIVCAPFILSFILFDVLDLDGSNFHRANPLEKSATAPEVRSISEFTDSLQPASELNSIIPPFKDFFARFSRQQQNRAAVNSSLISARAHRYKVSLARNSLSDSSPYG
jgi:hypothetical protein